MAAVIVPEGSFIVRQFKNGFKFYDRHFILVASAVVVLQTALIALVLAPLHLVLGPWDLLISALLFCFSLYSIFCVLRERFFGGDERASWAASWLLKRRGFAVFTVLVVLPLRLLLFSAAMAAVVYDLVIDHGWHNPFARLFSAGEVMLFFIDQALRRLLFELLGVLGVQVSTLTLAEKGSWMLSLALVPFRIAVEAVSIGYLWFLVQHIYKSRRERRSDAQREVEARPARPRVPLAPSAEPASTAGFSMAPAVPVFEEAAPPPPAWPSQLAQTTAPAPPAAPVPAEPDAPPRRKG